MKKKALFSIPISLLLIAMIVTSFFLIHMKPNTKNVSQAHKLAVYTKSSVVRILDYATVKWSFDLSDQRVINVLQKDDYKTSVSDLGSGVIISSNGYIITNSHVLESSHIMTDDDIGTNAFDIIVNEVASANNWDYDQTYDYMYKNTTYKVIEKGTSVYLPDVNESIKAEVKMNTSLTNAAQDVAVLKIDGKGFPTIPLGDSDSLQSQDQIWVIGYPAAADSNLFSDDSLLVPTMNEGQISAISKTTKQGTPVIQINAAATHGNSGGPVIDQNGKIIGLLTFRGDTVNGQEIQGFNFAIPVNTIKKYIDLLNVPHSSSNTDRLFKEGAELYWGGYYKDALLKFRTVQEIYPKYADINQFISDSAQKSDSSKILWTNYKEAFLQFYVISILIIISLLIYTFTSNSKQNVKNRTLTDQDKDG
ncbi:serine protease [Arthrobacter citreus]|nr:serine protease [Arthrobacter citreus]